MSQGATLAARFGLGKHARRLGLALVLGLAAGAAPAHAQTLAPAHAQATAPSLLSAQDAALYRAAFQAAAQGRWDAALQLSAQARDKLPAKILTWMELSDPDGGADFATLAAFIRANPDWPGLAALRRNAEQVLPTDLDAAEIRAWFAAHPPLSGAGVIRDAQALIDGGQTTRAAELVRERWVQGGFGLQDEQDIRSRFGRFLRPADHERRLDRLVWDDEETAAKRLYPLVDAGHRALAEARFQLAHMRPKAEQFVARVPTALRRDPGLLYDEARWWRRKDMDAKADQVLLQRPRELGRPGAWWGEMSIMARRAMDKGDYALAYRLVRDPGQTGGLGFAQAEFQAGWLALRFLNRPQEAGPHFQTLYDATRLPLSRSRSAYWLGRTAEATHKTAEAHRWYEAAAEYPATFYGQLALTRLGRTGRFTLPAEPVVPAAAAAAFQQNELVRLVLMIHQIDADPEREATFFYRLVGSAKSTVEFALIARLARQIDRPDLSVWTARQGAQKQADLPDAGYPVIGLPDTAPLEPALVLALIRQESGFNARAVSRAGARGLMQLMPATAQHLAGELGLKPNRDGLTQDPKYNVRLGSTYLANLVDRFNGSLVLAIAAYNAGPARVRQWLEQYGDPRAEGVDVEDWIELIPLYETRNYVQRVLEGLAIYRARLHSEPQTLALATDLRR